METKNRKSLTKDMVEMKAGGLSYAQIADTLGISRQGVQHRFKPLKAVMEEIADRARASCEECGQFDQFGHYHHKVYDFEILNEPDNIVYLCTACHLRHNGVPRFCKNCGKQVSKANLKYCSPECRQLYFSIPCDCSYCHRDFIMDARQKIRIRRSTSGLIFCSKRCQGKYIAEHYGFLAHPENSFSKNREGTSKYESLLPEIMMRLRNGESLSHILRKKGIPSGSHSMIGKLVHKYQATGAEIKPLTR